MTTHTTPIDLRPYHGRECEVLTIAGNTIKSKIMSDVNGRLYVQDDEGFLWIQFKNKTVFDGDYIKSITLLDEPKPINPEWDWKDGEEVLLGEERMRCRVIANLIVVFVADEGTDSEATSLPMTFREAYQNEYRKLPPQPQRKLVEITEEMFRSTAWYGKKVMYGELEQGVYAVHYNSGFFTLVQSGTVHYSQCKLIEE